MKGSDITRIGLFVGNIANVEADVLITAINSGGLWFGGIDGVINEHAGNFFHKQAADQMPLRDGQVIVASGEGCYRLILFRNVVFVVDDLRKPLRQIIKLGLEAADKAGFETVSIPTIRMGVMLGMIEKTQDEVLMEMAAAIEEFKASNPKSIKKITFVVYNDRIIAEKLGAKLRVEI